MKKVLITLLGSLLLFSCASTSEMSPEDKPSSEETREAAVSHQPDKSDVTSGLSGDETGFDDEYEAEDETLFYPMLPETPRLQYLASITRDLELDVKAFPVESANLDIRIERPYDFGSVKGKIYISDRTYKKLMYIDLKYKTLSLVPGDYEARGIWVTPEDHKYVTDFKKNQVLVFNENNEIARRYAYRNQFEKPVDVAVFEDRVYICDLNKHMVVVLNRNSGKTMQEIGGIGTEDGQFYKPTHVVVDKDGNLYVNDFFNMRVQKFDPEGEHLQSFGRPGDTIGSFARPKGISADREGHLYAVDAAFENVQIFDDETGEVLLFFGGFGLDSGQMYLPSPVHIDYENIEYFNGYAEKDFKLKYLVLVGNELGPVKVNIYGFGEWTGNGEETSEAEEEKTEQR